MSRLIILATVCNTLQPLVNSLFCKGMRSDYHPARASKRKSSHPSLRFPRIRSTKIPTRTDPRKAITLQLPGGRAFCAPGFLAFSQVLLFCEIHEFHWHKEREGEPAIDGSISCDVGQSDLHDDWADLHGGSPHSEATGAANSGTHRRETITTGLITEHRAPSKQCARKLSRESRRELAGSWEMPFHLSDGPFACDCNGKSSVRSERFHSYHSPLGDQTHHPLRPWSLQIHRDLHWS